MAGTKRRVDVMLSSTFRDLQRHRAAVIAAMNGLQLTPLAQEFDAALPDSDLIKASLDKVDAADVYVGLIGSRYGQRPECAIRNPNRLSLTELEYRRAVERGLPRLMFIMADDHELTLADFKLSSLDGDEGRKLQQAFSELVRKDRIAAEFSSPADLETKANKSFFALQNAMEVMGTASHLPALPQSPDDVLPTAPPAFHYVRKPYIEKQGFAGRDIELALIDRWAVGPEAMLLFQAIGGMGKSMLTWHWVKTRATAARSDWAGQLWYSFYEQGADLNDFCVHALAYIRQRPPRAFRKSRTLDLGDELRRELDARPWLLILDGLERVLVAYNRAGKEHMTDEEAVVARDGLGLDREPRSCFRPEDEDVLAMLAQVSRGKLLASSRLTPTALMNEARQPIPGVMRIALEGLGKEDAETVLRKAGVRGDGWRMRQFLADKFDAHPLSVSAVAGHVMTLLDARGDFDRWVEHPRGGGDPALITKDLRGRQNHILSRAFDDLDNDVKGLLGSIAMANIELAPDILRILNPKRPIEPQRTAVRLENDTPSAPDGDNAGEDEAYATAFVAWRAKADAADAWLERTLPELEARGLLQYDPANNSVDMHPAIRHTVLTSLSTEARGATGSHVFDALSSRPYTACEDARTREDLALVISRVNALNAAGRVAEACQIMDSTELAFALFRLEYHHEQLELMQPAFPRGWKEGPIAISDADDRATWSALAVVSLRASGQRQTALELQQTLIEESVTGDPDDLWGPVLFALGTFATDLLADNLAAHALRLVNLADRLANAGEIQEALDWVRAAHAWILLTVGHLDDARAQLPDEPSEPATESFVDASILTSKLAILFRAGRLTERQAHDLLKRVRSLGTRSYERTCLAITAQWLQERDDHLAARDVLGDLIAQANEIGSRELPEYEGLRAFSLAKLGRREEASRIAARIDRGKEPPHTILAKLHLALGDTVKAREHALAGFKKAWGQGRPYCNHWDLEACRAVLTAVNEREPALPPFDPTQIKPFTFESMIERLIAQMRAAKAAKVRKVESHGEEGKPERP